MTTQNTSNTPLASTSSTSSTKLSTAEQRRLKGIGHELKPIVLIGNNGVSESIINEINRALNDHELIKIKVPAGSKEEREAMSHHIADATGAQVVHHIGRMVLLLRRNPNASARLSNLIRHND